MKICTKSSITNVVRRKDSSCKVSLLTPKLTDEQLLSLLKLMEKELTTTFDLNEEQDQEMKLIEVKGDVFEKTPSQRLHSVLFLVWRQQYSETHKTFDEFYKLMMENIITQFKNKLL